MNTLISTNGVKTTMFYDGGCPLCSREVDHYKRMDVHNNVNWIDIHTDSEPLSKHGIEYITAMKRLHVLDTKGDIVIGAYAFQTLWKALPRYRYVALAVSLPGLLWVMDKIYSQFAKRRFSKRLACSNSQGK